MDFSKHRSAVPQHEFNLFKSSVDDKFTELEVTVERLTIAVEKATKAIEKLQNKPAPKPKKPATKQQAKTKD